MVSEVYRNTGVRSWDKSRPNCYKPAAFRQQVFDTYVEKVVLIRKIYSTESMYYEKPLYDRSRKKLRFDSLAVFGRKNKIPAKSENDTLDVGKNVGLI